MLNPNKEAIIARAKSNNICIIPKMANRHGLITGATGTGKTISLQVLAETFSQMGTAVFLADIKGDLSGLAMPGGKNPKVAERANEMKLFGDGFKYQAFPAIFWDVFGEQGHPMRATISEFGPLLLARLLDLNDTQSSVLNILFKYADDNGLLLLDLKDIRKLTEFFGNNRNEFTASYGNIAPASIGAIQRALLQLETQGAESFFGEPALNLDHLLQTDATGRGAINILAADKLMQSPRVYAAFLLWMLSELYEKLPECGDPEKPKLVFFFDEAHLLFTDAPKVLIEKVEQVVRLIRSKGVGIFFITQSQNDIPENILAQLGNRIQHALRAYTPKEQKNLKAAADSFRPNPAFDSLKAIADLEVGEALISFLDEKGRPAMAERTLVLPPQGGTGPITPAERKQLMAQSPVAGVYERILDRESAYEILCNKAGCSTTSQQNSKKQQTNDPWQTWQNPPAGQDAPRQQSKSQNKPAPQAHDADNNMWGDILGGIAGNIAKEAQRSLTKSVGSAIGRSIVRGVLGGVLGGMLGNKKK